MRVVLLALGLIDRGWGNSWLGATLNALKSLGRRHRRPSKATAYILLAAILKLLHA